MNSIVRRVTVKRADITVQAEIRAAASSSHVVVSQISPPALRAAPREALASPER